MRGARNRDMDLMKRVKKEEGRKDPFFGASSDVGRDIGSRVSPHSTLPSLHIFGGGAV